MKNSKKQILRRICSIALAGAMVFGVTGVIPAGVVENGITVNALETEDGFEYEVNDNEVTIDGYNGSDEDITIPAEIDGMAVTKISVQAFRNCDSLTSVTIPDSVTSIGGGAFSGCSSLTSVTIPDGITYIGNYLFEDCSSLTSVTIPDSVTEIGMGAFYGCDKLTSVTIPYGVERIAWYTFQGCSSLTSVTIPDSVTRIGLKAFRGCSSLTSVTIPDSVTSIDDEAFYNCYDLASVTIGKSVTNIGDYAFQWCSSLTSVDIPEGITSINKHTFYDCSSLTSVTIPDSVTSIGEEAFQWCSSLSSITIPDSVTSIGEGAFSYCEGLADSDGFVIVRDVLYNYFGEDAEITIPDSVTSIGDYAFSCCYSMISLTIPDSVTNIGECAFYLCNSLESVTIPDSVTSIGDSAFRSCKGLADSDGFVIVRDVLYDYFGEDAEITIPDSVISIGDYVFSYRSSITSITIPESVTSIGVDVFEGCSSDLTIYGVWGSEAAEYAKNNEIKFIDPSHTVHTPGEPVREHVVQYFYEEGSCEEVIYCSVCGEELSRETKPMPPIIQEKDGFCYRTGSLRDFSNDNIVTIVDYVGDETVVQIPEQIDGKTVTAIGFGIGDNSFKNGKNITKLIIPKTVEFISNSASGGFDAFGPAGNNLPSLEAIEVDEENLNYSSFDGVLMNKDQTTINYVPRSKSGKFTMPDTVENLRWQSFFNVSKLEEVTFSPKLKATDNFVMGSSNFVKCTSLKKINTDNSPNFTFKNGGLYGNTNYGKTLLICLDPENGIMKVEPDTNAVDLRLINGDLKCMIIPDSVSSINQYSFSNYTDLTIYGTKGSKAEQFANDNGYTFVEYVAPAYTPGDVNSDEAIDIGDALMVARFDAGLAELDETQVQAGNVNGDEATDIADALMIARYDAGLITEFPL